MVQGARHTATSLLGVTVFSEVQTPSVSIAPLSAKASPNANTFLHSTASFPFGEAGSQWLHWQAHRVDRADPTFNLSTSALTPLTQSTLALQSGALVAGGTYQFVLRAGDSAGAASAFMTVHVNEPPRHRNASGEAALRVVPSDPYGCHVAASSARWVNGVASGVALHDYFTAELRAWEDDLADLPLTYQEFETAPEEARYIDRLLQQGASELANGGTRDALALVDGISFRLNAGGEASLEQREKTALLLANLTARLSLTDSAVEDLADSVASLVVKPSQVGNATSAITLSLLQELADATLGRDESGSQAAALTQLAADGMAAALSSLSTVGASGNSTAAPSQVASTLPVMDDIGRAMGMALVEGMRAETASDYLALSVQLDKVAGLAAAASLAATGPSAT
eukprot:gene28156-34859_t